MKSLENIVAAIIAVCVLILIPIVMSDMHASRCLTVTGKGSVEELASQISKEKELAVFTYDQHADELYKCGFEGELQISFYVYEAVADGVGVESEQRRYVTTWEEIKEVLLTGDSYKFPDNCYVCVTARAYSVPPSGFELFVRTRTDYTASAYIERGYQY